MTTETKLPMVDCPNELHHGMVETQDYLDTCPTCEDATKVLDIATIKRDIATKFPGLRRVCKCFLDGGKFRESLNRIDDSYMREHDADPAKCGGTGWIADFGLTELLDEAVRRWSVKFVGMGEHVTCYLDSRHFGRFNTDGQDTFTAACCAVWLGIQESPDGN